MTDKPPCLACDGTGKNREGRDCLGCSGTGVDGVAVARAALLDVVLTPRDYGGEQPGDFPGEREVVRAVCEQWGYGRVQQLAAELWEQKDPVGGCQADREQIRAALHPDVKQLVKVATRVLRYALPACDAPPMCRCRTCTLRRAVERLQA